MRTIRFIFATTAFAGALLVSGTLQSPYIRLGSEAHAGIAECKARCGEKRATCGFACAGKPGSCFVACDKDETECKKDCEANAK